MLTRLEVSKNVDEIEISEGDWVRRKDKIIGIIDGVDCDGFACHKGSFGKVVCIYDEPEKIIPNIGVELFCDCMFVEKCPETMVPWVYKRNYSECDKLTDDEINDLRSNHVCRQSNSVKLLDSSER